MSINNSIPTKSNRASAVVIALIASLLVLVSPVSQSKADYIAFTNYTSDSAITYNDRVCNLGDPSTHLTAETAFEISTADQLWEVTDCVSNSATIYFKLGDDIDVSEATTAPTNSPIGFSTSALAYSFSGVLDGKNKTISGLDMSTSNYGVGLFTLLASAQIQNLTLRGSIFTSTAGVAPSDAAGGLASRATGQTTISNVSNFASVSGRKYVGGLIGYVDGVLWVESSSNHGSINASQNFNGAFVGGLIGTARQPVTIVDSQNTGEIQSAGPYVGGLLGAAAANANFLRVQNSGRVAGLHAGDFTGAVGGLVGKVDQEVRVTMSSNIGEISSDGNQVGGLVGWGEQDAYFLDSYNAGAVSANGDSNGLIGLVGNGNTNAGDLRIENSYGSTIPTGNFDIDPLASRVYGSPSVLSSYAFSASSLVSGSSLAQMQRADLYSGWNFVDTWGFGTCSDNGGLPILRVFAQVGTFYSDGCFTAPQAPASTPTPTPTPAPVYSGPIISGAPSAVAGTEVTLTGNRLESVTTAHVGGIPVRIVSALAQSLTLDIPSSMVPGSYDLVLLSSFGTLTIQNGLTVLAPLDTGSVVEATTKKLTVVALQGFISIYTKGYEGQRLSARVAGKWLVVPEISENWSGNNHSRTVRFTGAGESIKVHLYINREFVRTEEITTK